MLFFFLPWVNFSLLFAFQIFNLEGIQNIVTNAFSSGASGWESASPSFWAYSCISVPFGKKEQTIRGGNGFEDKSPHYHLPLLSALSRNLFLAHFARVMNTQEVELMGTQITFITLATCIPF
jgi:hypothetical protein